MAFSRKDYGTNGDDESVEELNLFEFEIESKLDSRFQDKRKGSARSRIERSQLFKGLLLVADDWAIANHEVTNRSGAVV